MRVSLPAMGLMVLSLSACVAPPPEAGVPSTLHKDVADLKQQVADLRHDMDRLNKTVAAMGQAPKEAKKAPTVTSVEMDDDPVMGKADAPVAIVEFSDYQCPYCNVFHRKVLPLLKKAYIDTGEVKFVYRDLALNFHPQSEGAAIAANCAGVQHKYWAMGDALFAHQRQLGEPLYLKLAADLKLDVAAFKSCLADPKQKAEVDADRAYGNQIGVEGTPTLYIGRVQGNRLVDVREIVGAQPPAVFASAIESFLAQARAQEK